MKMSNQQIDTSQNLFYPENLYYNKYVRNAGHFWRLYIWKLSFSKCEASWIFMLSVALLHCDSSQLILFKWGGMERVWIGLRSFIPMLNQHSYVCLIIYFSRILYFKWVYLFRNCITMETGKDHGLCTVLVSLSSRIELHRGNFQLSLS